MRSPWITSQGRKPNPRGQHWPSWDECQGTGLLFRPCSHAPSSQDLCSTSPFSLLRQNLVTGTQPSPTDLSQPREGCPAHWGPILWIPFPHLEHRTPAPPVRIHTGLQGPCPILPPPGSFACLLPRNIIPLYSDLREQRLTGDSSASGSGGPPGDLSLGLPSENLLLVPQEGRVAQTHPAWCWRRADGLQEAQHRPREAGSCRQGSPGGRSPRCRCSSAASPRRPAAPPRSPPAPPGSSAAAHTGAACSARRVPAAPSGFHSPAKMRVCKDTSRLLLAPPRTCPMHSLGQRQGPAWHRTPISTWQADPSSTCA